MRRTGIHTITFTAYTKTPNKEAKKKEEKKAEKGGLYLLSFREAIRIDEDGGYDFTSLVDYTPGSSLKGRMRARLETELGRGDRRRGRRGVEEVRPCQCAGDECPVCRVFGAHSNDDRLGPTRIIVRDGRCRETLQEDQCGAKTGDFDMEIVLQVYEVDAQFSYTRIRGERGKSYRGDEALQAVVADGLRMAAERTPDTRNRRDTGQIRFTDFKMDGAEWTIWYDSD